MCDCYGHKCEICEETIPMHIGDFNFPREDFKVYCNMHINQAPTGAVVFEIVNDSSKEFVPGWKCAIFGPEVGQTNWKLLTGMMKPKKLYWIGIIGSSEDIV